jgi:hypothetical protein
MSLRNDRRWHEVLDFDFNIKRIQICEWKCMDADTVRDILEHHSIRVQI